MYERFMQLLQENNITAYRVSKDTGVTQTTLSDWKTGRGTPRTVTLQKIADYFNVSLDWLAGNSEYRNISDYNKSQELSNVYFSLAKEAQNEGIDPDDIKLAIAVIKEKKKKDRR
ncbi:MAG: helix-turn-helix domain-containing protein [Oscillospiraceae bacterium]